MNVNKVVETTQGTIVFQGELSQEETDMVIKVGLTVLLQVGALKATGQDMPTAPETVQ